MSLSRCRWYGTVNILLRCLNLYEIQGLLLIEPCLMGPYLTTGIWDLTSGVIEGHAILSYLLGKVRPWGGDKVPWNVK